MRKAELRKTVMDGEITIYKSQQWRWESDQNADPQISDEAYHLTESEAIEAADKIDLDLGFEAQVEKITIDYDELNEAIDFREEFKLSKILEYVPQWSYDSETVHNGKCNRGAELDPDAIVVMYRHHRYMNYAYTIERVCFVRETELTHTADLRDDSDSLRTTYCAVVADLDALVEAFENEWGVPFDKINSGRRVIRRFLEENEHPNYVIED